MKSKNCVGKVDFSLRKASILDVPFILNLVLEGAEVGAFSHRFLGLKGPQRLLWFVFTGVLLSNRLFQKPPLIVSWYLIKGSDGEDLGFMKTTTSTDSHQHWHLDLLSIAPQYRNNGIGTAVTRGFIASAPDAASVLVSCTKFARGMQHILKKIGFHRKNVVGQASSSLEQYTLIAAEERGQKDAM